MVSPSDCSMGARQAFAVLGIALGIIAAIVFGVEYYNYNAVFWGLVSSVVAALTLYVHVTYRKQWYEHEPSTLRTFMYSGCMFQLVGLCGFVVYITLAIYNHQGVVIYGPGYYLASVWAFMTLKWGFQLFYFSRSYWRSTVAACQLLPPAEKADLAEYYGCKS